MSNMFGMKNISGRCSCEIDHTNAQWKCSRIFIFHANDNGAPLRILENLKLPNIIFNVNGYRASRAPSYGEFLQPIDGSHPFNIWSQFRRMNN